MMTPMLLRHELTYDAPPDEVFAMLSDPAFREKVCAAQQVVSSEVVVTPVGDGFTMVSTQVQRTAGLPAIARKFAGDTTEVVVEETWTTPTSGTIEITAPGKPTSAGGTITLTPSASGTVELFELEVKVKVPLIGGKLETLMADTIRSGQLVEQTVGATWLAGAR
jgi:uncharacterized protein YndB with AHSA1/START domain